MVQLWIRYRPIGWYANDLPFRVRIDEDRQREASLLSGLSWLVEAAPGPHTLTLEAGRKRRSLPFELPEPGDDEVIVLDISYDRMWGNFKNSLAISSLARSELPADPDDWLPREDEADDAPPLRQGKPIATIALASVLVLCFLIELLVTVAPADKLTPAIGTLRGLGGLDPQGIGDGQWFRLLSCTFLHADPVHLICNLVALVMAGFVIETRLGPRWFLAFYVIGGLGGSALSLRLNDGQMLSVGASGAIMGLLAAGLFVAQTMPKNVRLMFQFHLLRILVPSLLPQVTSSGPVDVGAHLGGALAGAAAGLALYGRFRALRRTAATGGDVNAALERLTRSPVATALAGSFVIASALTAGRVAQVSLPEARAQHALWTALIPNEELPEGAPSEELRRQWLARYPEDPRVISFAIADAIGRGQFDEAERLIERQRQASAQLRAFFPPDTQAMLAGDADHYEKELRLLRRLIPNHELPKGSPESVDATWQQSLTRWLREYPDDPRVREEAARDAIAKSGRAFGEGNPPQLEEAIVHARHGLATLPQFSEVLRSSAQNREWLVYYLATALWLSNRREEATPLLLDLCATQGEAQQNAMELKLCPTEPPVESPPP